MSSPQPRPTQHLVLEAEREHYADVRVCQDSRLIEIVSADAQAPATEGGRAYGTMRWTGLPRIVTAQVAVSLPAPVTL